MNLLSLIIIFLALVVVAAIAYIAWELTSERSMPRSDKEEPDASKESKNTPGSGGKS
jgi:flagellar basal body-associated protein FliL